MEPASLYRRLQSVPTNSTGVGSADLYTTYVVPPTRDGVASVVVNVLMVFLASIWTVLRFYARRLKGQPWYFEDFLCLFALVRPAQNSAGFPRLHIRYTIVVLSYAADSNAVNQISFWGMVASNFISTNQTVQVKLSWRTCCD